MTDSTDNARGPERIFAEVEPYDFEGYSPCFVWHNPDSLEDGADGAVEYVRADLAPLDAVKVKPLRWEGKADWDNAGSQMPDGSYRNYRAITPFGTYFIHYRKAKYRTCLKGLAGLWLGEWGQIEDAIRTGNNDYDARIRSALEPADVMADPRVWQPIGTAPKDTLIDIWLSDGVRWCDCYYDRICDEWRTSRPSGRLLSIKAMHVTHWMPRPASPALASITDTCPACEGHGCVATNRSDMDGFPIEVACPECTDTGGKADE